VARNSLNAWVATSVVGRRKAHSECSHRSRKNLIYAIGTPLVSLVSGKMVWLGRAELSLDETIRGYSTELALRESVRASFALAVAARPAPVPNLRHVLAVAVDVFRMLD
jgi:hypothetical protein